jgi:hypothetical protein
MRHRKGIFEFGTSHSCSQVSSGHRPSRRAYDRVYQNALYMARLACTDHSGQCEHTDRARRVAGCTYTLLTRCRGTDAAQPTTDLPATFHGLTVTPTTLTRWPARPAAHAPTAVTHSRGLQTTHHSEHQIHANPSHQNPQPGGHISHMQPHVFGSHVAPAVSRTALQCSQKSNHGSTASSRP